MSILKKTLLGVSIVILALCAIIFVGHGIDWVRNGSTYTAIDTFFKTQDDKNIHFKECLAQSKQIGMHTQNVVVGNPNAIIPQEYKEDKVYNDAISACNRSYTECGKILIPKNVPEKTAALLQKALDSKKQIIKYYIVNLTKLKACKGKNVCITNLLHSNNSETLNLLNASSDYASAVAEVTKRFSLTSFIQQNKAKKNIKQIEILKKYLNK